MFTLIKPFPSTASDCKQLVEQLDNHDHNCSSPSASNVLSKFLTKTLHRGSALSRSGAPKSRPVDWLKCCTDERPLKQ